MELFYQMSGVAFLSDSAFHYPRGVVGQMSRFTQLYSDNQPSFQENTTASDNHAWMSDVVVYTLNARFITSLGWRLFRSTATAAHPPQRQPAETPTVSPLSFPCADNSSLNNGKITLRGQLPPTNWPKITSRGQLLPTSWPQPVSSRTQILDRLLLGTHGCNIRVSFQQNPPPPQYPAVFTALLGFLCAFVSLCLYVFSCFAFNFPHVLFGSWKMSFSQRRMLPVFSRILCHFSGAPRSSRHALLPT
jgi:hypothetical protein